MSDDRYFAADDTDRAVAAFDERVQDFYDHVANIGLVDLWRATNRACFAGFHSGGEIGRVGKQGEVRTLEFNELGNLKTHLYNLITAQRPAFEGRTDTIDSTAQQQAPIGVSVVETAMRDKGLEAKSRRAVDVMLRGGESFILKRWDPRAGPIYSSEPVLDEAGQPVLDETGQPQERGVPGGDVEFGCFHPIDVARDWTRPADEQRWWVPRRRANRYDLATQHPDLTERILKAPNVLEQERGNRPALFDQGRLASLDRCDDVWIYEPMVDRGPATPEGRLISYLTPDCVLFDGPLPYRELPLYRMAAQELEGAAFGYSLLWDILAPQMALNNVASQITTMASQLRGVIWEPDGKGLTPSKVANLITILKGGTIPPQVLDLFKVPGELFKLVEFYLQSMERLSGINSIYRGQAAEGQKGLSGAAYALFAARAIEFGSALQAAYNTCLERVASATIADYQDMGAGEYLLTLAGEGNGYQVQAFLGGRADEASPDAPGSAPRIDKVAKITVKTANPMQSTTAGRMQLFDSLVQIPGAIKTPAEALQVITTGKLDPATQSTQRELENIQKENERLGKGEPVMTIASDRHWLHLPEHAGVASSPEAREDEGIAEVLAMHIEEHLMMLRAADPILLAIQGCPPEIVQMVVMASQPMLPPGTPGAPPPEGGGEPPSLEEAMPGPESAAGMPSLPQMPADPLTGEQMAPPAAA